MIENQKKENKRIDKELNFSVFSDDYLPRISQWFISLEGEGQNIGEPSLYIRLAGCYSAACKFCDTKFSWYNKKKFPLLNDNWESELFNQEKEKIREINRLTVTGGEPLHYMNTFEEILKNVKTQEFEDVGIKINWLGIESNGNILKDKSNIFNLIKIFKNIERNYGIKPVLTISPKLDADSCYNNLINQETVEKMYDEVFKNIYEYFPYEVNYKFIWSVSKLENQLTEDYIKGLILLYKVPSKNIFLMPFTPTDPLGSNIQIWQRSKDKAARKALELGIRYSPRIHVDRQLD